MLDDEGESTCGYLQPRAVMEEVSYVKLMDRGQVV